MLWKARLWLALNQNKRIFRVSWFVSSFFEFWSCLFLVRTQFYIYAVFIYSYTYNWDVLVYISTIKSYLICIERVIEGLQEHLDQDILQEHFDQDISWLDIMHAWLLEHIYICTSLPRGLETDLKYYNLLLICIDNVLYRISINSIS